MARIYRREESSPFKSNVIYDDAKKQPLNLPELFNSVTKAETGTAIIMTREALLELLTRAINAEADVMLN